MSKHYGSVARWHIRKAVRNYDRGRAYEGKWLLYAPAYMPESDRILGFDTFEEAVCHGWAHDPKSTYAPSVMEFIAHMVVNAEQAAAARALST